MTPFNQIESAINSKFETAQIAAEKLIGMAEDILRHYLIAIGQDPKNDAKEGFVLLGLHRQGAKGDVSFNACRETCREAIYLYNLIKLDSNENEDWGRIAKLRRIAMHLYLFINGKMENAKIGEFCCAAKPLRLNENRG